MTGTRNKSRPKVTVIIPSYNRENFIQETIDSALSQTYSNLEIVVIDDGSTDKTLEILHGYGNRIQVMEHPGQVNKGQSAAINLGIQSTESKYLAVLDSDDLWTMDKIERQVAFLEGNEDVGLVYSNGFAIDEKGKRLHKLFQPGHKETNRPGRILLDCYIGGPLTYLVRRSVVNKAGAFDETLRSSQDHDMAIRISEITEFGFLDKELCYYRKHSDTISNKFSRGRWEAGFKILTKARRRHNYDFFIIRKRLAVLNFRLGQCFLEEKNYLRALGRFAISGLLDPLRAIWVLVGLERRDGLH